MRRKETSPNKKLHACLLFKVAIFKCSGDIANGNSEAVLLSRVCSSGLLLSGKALEKQHGFSRAVALEKQPSTFEQTLVSKIRLSLPLQYLQNIS